MRIVAHNGARIWGGAERATVELLRGLAGRGHHVELLCNSDLVRGEAQKRGVPARICVIGGDMALTHSLRLAAILSRETPDVFLISTYKKLFLASLAGRIARVPRSVARVGLESDNPRSFKYRFALRRWVDGVAVNASRMASAFAIQSLAGHLRIAVIPNGVVTPPASRSVARVRAEFGIGPDAIIVGTIARLATQKRLDRLIEASRRFPLNAHLLIVGEGSQRKSLEEQAARSGRSHCIHFAGNRDDTGDILRAFDIFVISSDQEGLSNAMLEAMSCGVAVVSTDVSGAGDALIDGSENGPAGLVTGLSSDDLARGILALIDDRDLRHAFGANGRERAASLFSFELMLDRWEAFLDPSGVPTPS